MVNLAARVNQASSVARAGAFRAMAQTAQRAATPVPPAPHVVQTVARIYKTILRRVALVGSRAQTAKPVARVIVVRLVVLGVRRSTIASTYKRTTAIVVRAATRAWVPGLEFARATKATAPDCVLAGSV